jgi:aminotransferase EvaB
VYSAEFVDRQADPVESVARVTARHRYVLGTEVERFEDEFAAYCGVSECVTAANGTDALEIALRCLGIGRGSRVALVANAGFYASAAVLAVGGVPVYVDVDEESLTMSVDGVRQALTTKVDAVVVTHLYGRLAAVEELAAACEGAGVPLIEDCAQAHGASRGGRRAGSFGTIGCFSFYPTKNLPAIGDAGALTTNDSGIARTARSLRQYGWSDKYTVQLAGGRNSRMDEIQAAVLNDRLPLLEGWNRERQEIARRYETALSGASIRLPMSDGPDYVAHLVVARVADRGALRRYLSDRHISSDVHYPVADDLQPALEQSHDAMPTDLAVTVEACRTVVTLPCFPGMADEQVGRVTDAVLEFVAGGG